MTNIRTEVRHSLSNNAWNVVGVYPPGAKYKIARVPYLVLPDNEILNTRNKYEALEHAMFISKCFNDAFLRVGI